MSCATWCLPICFGPPPAYLPTTIWTPHFLPIPASAHLVGFSEAINVEGAWSLGYTGAGVNILFSDDALDVNHPDFASKFNPSGGSTASSILPRNVTYSRRRTHEDLALVVRHVSRGRHCAATSRSTIVLSLRKKLLYQGDGAQKHRKTIGLGQYS